MSSALQNARSVKKNLHKPMEEKQTHMMKTWRKADTPESNLLQEPTKESKYYRIFASFNQLLKMWFCKAKLKMEQIKEG